jgi:hypothetical protein
MHLPHWKSMVAGLVVLAAASPGVAQNPSGPQTLENIVNPGDGPEGADPTLLPRRPARSLARPQDGVQSPDLDDAWSKHETSVTKFVETVRETVAKRIDKASAKGNLDEADKWQAVGNTFAVNGELLALAESDPAISTAVADYDKAKVKLIEAYDAVVEAMTMAKMIEDAKAVRDESQALMDEGLLKVLALEKMRKRSYRKVIISPGGHRQEVRERFEFKDHGVINVNGKPSSLKWTSPERGVVRIDIGNPHGYVQLAMQSTGVLTGQNQGRADRTVWGWELWP